MRKPVSLKKSFSASKIKVRANKIRSSFRFGSASESIAREFAVRTLVMPSLKKRFGSRLKAVLLVGSSQQGVRKASINRLGSDVDVVCFVEFGSNYREPGYLSIRGVLDRKVKSAIGVNLSLMFSNASDFRVREKNNPQAFQVLFGNDFIKEHLNRDIKTSSHLKTVQKNSFKYSKMI